MLFGQWGIDSISAEKFKQGQIEISRLFELRNMTAFVDNHSLRAGDILGKSFSHSQWRQFIFTPPYYQGRGFNILHSLINKIFIAKKRINERIDGVRVTPSELVGERLFNKLIAEE